MTDGTAGADDDRSQVTDATGRASNAGPALLEVDDLKTHYELRKGWLRRLAGTVRAVDGVSFAIEHGETLGLVGESGSGKSTVARTILQLEDTTAGTIRFEGDAVGDLSGAGLREFRRRVQLVAQDPNEAFSPRMRIGEAVAEPLRLHGMADGDRRRAIVTDLLERVGLSAEDADRYPHEFSGGEKQRIAIARALVTNPDLIIADEPTSALDSRVQSDVLALLDEIRREYDVAVLYISHDIDTVRLFCDRIAVMYLGELVEKGPIESVLEAPAHPYTRVLLGSIPSLDPADRELARPLTEQVPDPSDPPSGCRFHTRCPEIIPPADVDIEPGVWQGIAEFRFTVASGELSDELRRETDEAVLREHFGIPETLGADDIEEPVARAIDALLVDDVEEATDVLASAFTTPCEEQEPADSTHEGRFVRCHRYDDAHAADPLSYQE